MFQFISKKTIQKEKKDDTKVKEIKRIKKMIFSFNLLYVDEFFFVQNRKKKKLSRKLI